MPKISIIIPVYNVSQYIERCLKSIIAQSYPNIECILVDDCSPDDSIEKCQEIISNYSGPIGFKILHHKSNRGLSAARNTGTNAATGEYIYYLDSDDEISKDCISKMVEAAATYKDVDMVIGQYSHNSNANYPRLKLCKGAYDNDILNLYAEEKIYMMAWNKLCRKSFLVDNKIQFEEGLLHEDIPWSFKCSCYMKKMVILEDITYYYNIRNNSIQSGTDRLKHIYNYWLAYMKMLDDCFESGAHKKKEVYNYIFHRIHLKYTELLAFGNKQDLIWFYIQLRRHRYWNLLQIYKFTKSIRMIFFHLHRYLPYRFGAVYFRNFYAKFIK